MPFSDLTGEERRRVVTLEDLEQIVYYELDKLGYGYRPVEHMIMQNALSRSFECRPEKKIERTVTIGPVTVS